jgi:hypothetical protein
MKVYCDRYAMVLNPKGSLAEFLRVMEEDDAQSLDSSPAFGRFFDLQSRAASANPFQLVGWSEHGSVTCTVFGNISRTPQCSFANCPTPF